MNGYAILANLPTFDMFKMWNIVIGLIGGLALFLYGIDKMSEGLRAVAGDGLKILLAKLTSNSFTAVLTGIIVTGIIQSSSLTTVLVVGFISAGLLTLKQSIGVIMGANIGTTLTIHIAAFKITQSAWLLVAIGFGVAILRRDATRQLGSVLIGLGMLFLALEQMASATNPLRDYPLFLDLMQRLEHPVLGILIGAIFTAVVQSSTATSGVVIALSSQGLLQLPAALAIVLGANLGSCATAFLASIGKTAEARRAVVVHVIFNVFGILVWIFLIPQMCGIVASLSSDLPRQIAYAHTIFNVSNVAVLIWFTRPLERLAHYLVPDDAPLSQLPDTITPKFVDYSLLSTPSLAIDRFRLELGHIGEHVLQMLEKAEHAVFVGTRDDLDEIADMEKKVNQLYVVTVEYARQLAREKLSLAETKSLEDCLAAVNYLENAGDVIASNLVTQGRHRLDNNLTISRQTQDALESVHVFVADALRRAIETINNPDAEVSRQVIAGKEAFNHLSNAVLARLRNRLMIDGGTRVQTFQMEVDLVNQYQRLHYFARRVAKLGFSNGNDVTRESVEVKQP
ncbi:MAG TPA: Na/Pi cotransporter family protein [Pirellulaceae bacterium]|nr:Na/Pi cotransporter family protein [Pirellulaceae bacterium]HMO91513.1 Na/Pi cotransporter family protein [Pirellulaceae bacterium]HMP71373.1 Na/Pi cotransporter family protein [Pirellulaceae bacterium]